MPNQDLCKLIHRSQRAIYAQAHLRGLRKSPEFYQQFPAGRFHKGKHTSPATEFKPGHIPHNKGKPHPSKGRSPDFHFKPGNKPHQYAPIGSERITRDGYLQRKVTDTGYPPKDWVAVHVLVWQAANGQPVPKGHAVVFKDGDKRNHSADNLELVSRAELMRRNTIHRYPPELKHAIRLANKLTRLTSEEKNHEAD